LIFGDFFIKQQHQCIPCLVIWLKLSLFQRVAIIVSFYIIQINLLSVVIVINFPCLTPLDPTSSSASLLIFFAYLKLPRLQGTDGTQDAHGGLYGLLVMIMLMLGEFARQITGMMVIYQ
jgi:hypothetical protein